MTPATTLVAVLATMLTADVETFDDVVEDVSKADQIVADRLARALLSGDRAGVGELIRYPLARAPGLKPIPDAKSFVRAFDDFFDAAIINDVTSSRLRAAGWRGPQLGRYIKIKDGLVDQIHSKTSTLLAKEARASSLRESLVHPSARGEGADTIDCATKLHRVRVRRHPDQAGGAGWKLFLWDGRPSEPPGVSALGVLDWAGSSGAFQYTFIDGAFTYRCSWVGMGANGRSERDMELEVRRNGKVVESGPCAFLEGVSDEDLQQAR